MKTSNTAKDTGGGFCVNSYSKFNCKICNIAPIKSFKIYNYVSLPLAIFITFLPVKYREISVK